jgi:DNA-binding response OmpR family regulator
MDGAETCRERRRTGSDIPVIPASGCNETEATGRFEGLGLAGFIQKPFHLNSRVEQIRAIRCG